MYYNRVQCFDSIGIRSVTIESKRILGTVDVTYNGRTDSFRLIFTYDQKIAPSENLAGLILTMPLVNFTYFAANLELNFPVSRVDVEMLRHFIRTNNREVFVNKICRRRYEFFREEYLPGEEEINEDNAAGGTGILATSEFTEQVVLQPDAMKSAVLSSGGKESLLTYGMMREMGSTVYPYFFNESGKHWLAAKPAYDFMSETDENCMKVWSNVDRFYRFMLRRMKILDPAFLRKKTDTYPIQLFIFPVYVFSLLPLAFKHRIGNMLLGDEFDDPREMPPFHGIGHYYGIYDQSQDFNDYITSYLKEKGMGISQWSAVYSVTGSIVERILIERYPDLFRLQRSCHSCRAADGEVLQCGKCTKCLGVMLFILAAGGKPELIGFSAENVSNITELGEFSRIRLDHDELETVLARGGRKGGRIVEHVDGIHILPWEEAELSGIPLEFRLKTQKILEKYTSGKFSLEGKNWIRI